MAENKKIKIVMFNMSSYCEWERDVQNRNWHILRHLLQTEEVEKIIAVDYPPRTFKRAIKTLWQQLGVYRGKTKIFKSLFSSAFTIDEKLVVYSSLWPYFSQKRFYQQLNELLAELDFDDYLLWSYYPLEIGYFNRLKPALKIFDAVDNWALHPSYRRVAAKLKDNYKLIDEQADVIFTVAEELKSLFAHQEKVHFLPNGVELKHYQKEYNIINRDIGDLPQPIIGYLGVIQDRLDLALLEYLAQNNPEKTFVLAGPVWYKSIEARFKKYANVHFLGRKSYDEAPMYLRQFAVGLVPHKIDNFIKTTNPMKIYEYLACGKPVVSTQSSGLADLDKFVYSANSYEEFNQQLNLALTEDKPKLKELRLAAVSEHSWLKRIKQMLAIVYQKI
ncbi:MAG: glycosyltransferase [Candidatus Komeilibacteria bacterium]|nr:glycosyltransferase [Candidatus Komeilibacteria bacterium]